MSLVPAFEIGLLNAWIFMLIYLFVHQVPLALLNLVHKGAYQRSAAAPTGRTRRIDRFVILVIGIAFIYSIFLPLALETAWLYAGSLVFLLGLTGYTIASVNLATTPLDEPITKGLYRFSRHPMYLAIFLEFIGVTIATASWVFLLLSITLIILTVASVALEERFCLEKYGQAYRDYVNTTPRWLGVPKAGEKG